MMKQNWDVHDYDQNARFVTELAGPVIDLLDLQQGEHVLDLGCGDGLITKAFQDMGAKAVGVDSSPAFVKAARDLGVECHLMAGQNLTFDTEFDAVFSNAALHWMQDADAVIKAVARALKPGGRFVGEFGGKGNVAAICTSIASAMAHRGLDPKAAFPWYFPTAQEYQSLLEANGFTVSSLALIPRPTPLPTDMMGWLKTFSHAYLANLPSEDVQAILEETVAALELSLRDEAGVWYADYVRLRFSAKRT